MLNTVTPSFKARIRLYLKPKNDSIVLKLTLLLVDTLLAITYLSAQLAYIFQG